jgi:Flp pilus assembly protein TadG
MHREQFLKHRGERGFVILLWTLMMLFLILPMVGLAIDAGILYTIKAKLQTSVDGAALGAARSLNRSQDVPSQQTDATNTAKRYYHANFPDSWMGVTPVNDPTVSWPNAPTGTAIINVQGTVDAPTWFMKVLAINSVRVVAVGQATRRNVNIMLVLDRSGSLGPGPIGTNSCAAVVSGAQTFVNSFSNNRDRIGMVSFGTYYNQDYVPTMDFLDSAHNGANSLSTVVLPQLVCTGYTNAAAAFSYAYSILKGLGDHNALNVILLFTDGMPNTLTFGPDYGTLTGPILVKKAGSSCVLAAGHTGFSGAIAGDPSYSSQSGVLLAMWSPRGGSGYPAPNDSSEYGDASNIIGSNQGRRSGCAFPGNTANFPSDINAIPTSDSWGNPTTTTWAGGAETGFPASVNTTHINNQADLENAGINALDNAAQRARVDAVANSIPFLVYTIGLGNAPGGVNNELLQRIGNDVTSGVHQTAYPDGKYMFSPTTAQLGAAFAVIASDILRISQ